MAKNDAGGEPGMYMCHGMGNNQVLNTNNRRKIELPFEAKN